MQGGANSSRAVDTYQMGVLGAAGVTYDGGISIAGVRSRGIVVSALDVFARCVASLYDAALDDARWPAARVFVSGLRPRHRLAKTLLRLPYLADAARLRRAGVRP